MQHEFRLRLIGPDPDDEANVFWEVASAALDSDLHPNGLAKITTPSAFDSGGLLQVSLTSFQVLSLLSYLSLQQEVRHRLTLESRLDRQSYAAGQTIGEIDQWVGVRIVSLVLYPRQLFEAEELDAFKQSYSESELASLLAASDQHDTASCFRVMIRCEWDLEHDRFLVYRDGAFVDYGP